MNENKTEFAPLTLERSVLYSTISVPRAFFHECTRNRIPKISTNGIILYSVCSEKMETSEEYDKDGFVLVEMTPKEAADILKISEAKAKAELNALCKSQYLRKSSDGKYNVALLKYMVD